MAWCSRVLRTISSPTLSSLMPQLWATRLIASVVPRVQITSWLRGALIKRATVSRAASKARVARPLRAWAARCTLALSAR
ncbi:hypothetical protein D3C75_1159850 [compost metagenome]